MEVKNMSALPGGMGNVGATISRIGGTVSLCGAVGDDLLGKAYAKDLEKNSIIPALQNVGMHSTGLLLALISKNGERSFLVSRGANDYLKLEHIKKTFKKFRPNVVVISGYTITRTSMESVLLNTIELANNNNSKVVFDCTPFNLVDLKREIFTRIVEKSFCTCLNYDEACSLVGTSGLERVIRNLQKRKRFFALKLGFRGCVLVTTRGVKRIRSKKAEVKDTNGAGDCFIGAVAFGISRNLAELEMGELGVRLGTLKTQYPGPRLPSDLKINIPSYKEQKILPRESRI